MKKYSKKRPKSRKKTYQTPRPKSIQRSWDLATRLEHRRIKSKRK